MYPRIEKNGRLVAEITSHNGQLHYYEHLTFQRSCRYRVNPPLRIIPSLEEAEDYISLEDKIRLGKYGDKIENNRYNSYRNKYDWRAQLTGQEGARGLATPNGKMILPEQFHDIYTQFEAIFSLPRAIPVSNGMAWGLATPGRAPLLLVDFKYKTIMPERWHGNMFLVQDLETGKWGALSYSYEKSSLKRKFHFIDRLYEVMPPIADEIYEDEYCYDDYSQIFYMTRVGDKIGILTNFGYSDIIYDTYEQSVRKARNKFSDFRLIRCDKKKGKLVSFTFPNGYHQRHR